MQFTRMFSRRPSGASAAVNRTTAALLAAYTGAGCGPTPIPAIEAILMMTPPPEFRIAAIACCVPKRTPRTLTSTTRSQRAGSSSGNTSRGVIPASTMPALFTRMSSRPKDAHTSSMILRMPSSFATSPGITPARPPSCSMTRTLSSASPSSMSLTATVAPSRASRRAVARPIPDPEPVTSAIACLMFIGLVSRSSATAQFPCWTPSGTDGWSTRQHSRRGTTSVGCHRLRAAIQFRAVPHLRRFPRRSNPRI